MGFPTGPYDRDDSWQAQALSPDYSNQHRPGGPEPYTQPWLDQRAHDAQNAAFQANMRAVAEQMQARPALPLQPHDAPSPTGLPTSNPWSPSGTADAYSDSPYAALSSQASPTEPYRRSPWEDVGQGFRRLAGWLPAVIALAIVGASVMWLSDLRLPDPDGREALKDSAASFCKQMAVERLGTPAAAEFSYSSVTASDVDEYFDYFVIAAVQWQAGGSVLAREDLQCKVRYNRDTNGWTLQRIEGGK
jgi:hypothetical protein